MAEPEGIRAAQDQAAARSTRPYRASIERRSCVPMPQLDGAAAFHAAVNPSSLVLVPRGPDLRQSATFDRQSMSDALAGSIGTVYDITRHQA
jgi:hypothetical protein